MKDSVQQTLEFNDEEEITLQDRREYLLRKLLSPTGKNKNNPYKRYRGTLLRYAGGKSLAVGLVTERIPNDAKRLISPFLGGGSLETAIANELDLKVIGSDIFDILINFWDFLLNHNNELADRLEHFEPTKENYYEQKKIMKKHWDGEELLQPLELAAQYYFSSQCSYGPHFLGWPSSVYLQEKRYKTHLQKMRNFSCKNLKVRCESFERFIPRVKHAMLKKRAEREMVLNANFPEYRGLIRLSGVLPGSRFNSLPDLRKTIGSHEKIIMKRINNLL